MKSTRGEGDQPSTSRGLGWSGIALHWPLIVRARWRHTQTGREYGFESGSMAENRERHVRNGRIAVRVDPKNPKTYRFEAYASAAQAGRSSAVE